MIRRARNELRPVVWIVSREHWPRACLRAELIERGYHAIGFDAVPAAQLALKLPAVPPPSATVVDLSGQSGDCERLTAFMRAAGRLIGVAGALEAQSDDVRQLPWTAFLLRPVSLGHIADAVDAVMRPLRPAGDVPASAPG